MKKQQSRPEKGAPKKASKSPGDVAAKEKSVAGRSAAKAGTPKAGKAKAGSAGAGAIVQGASGRSQSRSPKSDAAKPGASGDGSKKAGTSKVRASKAESSRTPSNGGSAIAGASKAASPEIASPKTGAPDAGVTPSKPAPSRRSADGGAAESRASRSRALTPDSATGDLHGALQDAATPAPVTFAGEGARSRGGADPRRVLSIRNANVHNLRNVSLELPRNRLIVVSGVSGSGKSSLAFDTIYAEGQRRYVESLSAYARQFLARMAKPDVESITGLAPAIAIEQKTVTKNARSTVGTTTEVYDYLRLLFARIGRTYCRNCQQLVRKDTTRTVQQSLADLGEGARLYVLFPMHAHEQRTLTEELDNLREKGFYRVVLGESSRIVDLNEGYPEEVDKEHVLVLADRIVYRDEAATLSRLADSIETAFREGDGRAIVHLLDDDSRRYYSTRYECANCGIRYEEPQPKLFSFNNPFGACPECQGFGKAIGIDIDLVIPDRSKTLRQGAIAAFSTPKHSKHFRDLVSVSRAADVDLDVPVESLSPREWEIVMRGYGGYAGIDGFFKLIEEQTYKMHYRVFLSRFRGHTTCPRCRGSRLRTSAMRVFIHGKSLHDIVSMTIGEAHEWFRALELTEHEHEVAKRILEEINKRLTYLYEVGLEYLKLDRLSHTLSGGESQRINLATSIGSSLVGAMYVLDEPSIGLHPRDTDRLVRILKSLRDLGNTVIVVEHDPDIIRSADRVVDMGPRAGENGGQVVFNGTVDEMLADERSITGRHLSGRSSIPTPTKRREPGRERIVLRGAGEHNLKRVDVEFPLRMLTVVTGVSGSGKSTLVHDVLYPAVGHIKGMATKMPKHLAELDGAGSIGAVEMVDQSPIGRSPRSNPVTYVKAFDAIRDLYALTPVARLRGWKPGYFSFNVPGGRCEACQGEGVVKVEMQFLADLYLECEVCKGKRYKGEVLQATFRGKHIVDVLEMTVEQAVEFFAGENRIVTRLRGLQQVGLGYIRLGQPATTLSGGEAQRVKLAASLVSPAAEHTLFILDEPTTGLHFDDIATLLGAFDALIEAGHSLIVIEHNLDVIKSADWVIDLGPEGGDRGGTIVATGTPEQIARTEASHTGRHLRGVLPGA